MLLEEPSFLLSYTAVQIPPPKEELPVQITILKRGVKVLSFTLLGIRLFSYEIRR